MKNKRINKIWSVFVAAALTVGCLAGCGISSRTVRVGSAPVGGVYYMVINSLVGLMEEEDTGYDFDVRNTTGSVANLRLLSEDYIQMGIAQADVINDVYYGEGNYKGKKQLQGYSAIGSPYTEVMQIVVRADSDIKSLDDLQGKTVSVGAEESGSEQNAEKILDACGLTDGLIKKVNMDYTESAQKLEDKEIDAIFCTSGLKTTMIDELSRQCKIRLLGIDDTVEKRMKGEFPFYLRTVIPAGTYVGQEEEVSTLGVKTVVCVSNKMADDLAYSLTEILNNKEKSLQYSSGVTIETDDSRVASGITIPFHSGAEKYYEEQGIQVEKASTKGTGR